MKGVRLALALLILAVPFCASAPPGQTEYQIKAAFLYKFIFFTQWPRSMETKSELTIGIVGDNPFGDAFDPVAGTKLNGQTLVVKHFEEHTPGNLLKECQVLFIAASTKDRQAHILDSLDEAPVLTVSDTEGFAEAGGILNFVLVKDTIRFEINKSAAKRSGIALRSKLLRIAVRIIGNSHDMQD